MQFKLELIQAMRDGHKKQTRRVKRRNEELIEFGDLPTVVVVDYSPPEWRMEVVRLKWQVGRRYVIQPGRGKKAAGSFECVGLREERLWDIKWIDVVREGIQPPIGTDFVDCGFIELWDSIAKVGERWADNPPVWVIDMGEFEWEVK